MLNFATRAPKLNKSVVAGILKSSSTRATTTSSFAKSLLKTSTSTRLFRTSAFSMVAQKIDGTAIAKYD
jgi:hypothetical protein